MLSGLKRNTIYFGMLILACGCYQAVPISRPMENPSLLRNDPLIFHPHGRYKHHVDNEVLSRTLAAMVPHWRVKKINKVLHSLRLWGLNASFPEVSGEANHNSSSPSTRQLANALLSEHSFSELGMLPSFPLIYGREGVEIVVHGESGGVAHAGQMLQTFSEIGMGLNEEYSLKNKIKGNVEDLLVSAIKNFDLRGETEFYAVAFSRYLPPYNEWQNKHGELFNFDLVARHLMKRELNDGACNGIHGHYALMNILHADNAETSATGIISSETRDLIHKHFIFISKQLKSNQDDSGAWFSNWNNNSSPTSEPSEAMYEAIWVTGHHLEWIAIAPEELVPPEKSIAKAISFICKNLAAHPSSTTSGSYAPFSHAARSLITLKSTDATQYINN